MATQVAFGDAGAQEGGVELPLAFKERAWVPAFVFLVDVVTVQLALLLGFGLRIALSVFWPILLPPISFSSTTTIELAVAVLALPVVFAAIGLCPGYGLGHIERFRRRVSATVLFFGCLIVWDNIENPSKSVNWTATTSTMKKNVGTQARFLNASAQTQTDDSPNQTPGD